MKYIGDSTPAWSIGKEKKNGNTFEGSKWSLDSLNFGSLKASKTLDTIGTKLSTTDELLKSQYRKTAFTFSKVARTSAALSKSAEKIPGVGQYDIGYYDLSRNGPPKRTGKFKGSKDTLAYQIYKHSLTGSLEKPEIRELPYTIAYRAQKGLGFSMQYKTDPTPPVVPPEVGPGLYDIEKSFLSVIPKIKGVKFSKKGLQKTSTLNKSADDLYKLSDSLEELRKPRSKRGTFGKSSKGVLPPPTTKPEVGPGAYWMAN